MVSFFISSRLQRRPIYEELARQDGIHLPSAETRQQGVQRQVRMVMRPAAEVFDAQMTAGEALEKVRDSKLHAWPVSDEHGVIGVVTLNKLKQILAEGGAHKSLRELVDSCNFPHLHADQPIPLALERMAAAQVDALPVVSRADVQKLEGIVALRDVLKLYGFAPSADQDNSASKPEL